MNMYNILDRLKELAAKDPHYADAARSTEAMGQPVLEGVSGEKCSECGMYESHCTGHDEEIAESKPDFLDLDKDGNKKESMKKAAADKDKVEESAELASLLKHAGIGPMLGTSMSQQVDTVVESIKTTKNILNEGRQAVAEKWAGDAEVKSTGQYAGKSVAELQKSLSALKKSGPHKEGSAENKRMKQIQFAIRSKKDWKGGVNESEEVEESRDEKTHSGGTITKTDRGVRHSGKYGSEYQGDDDEDSKKAEPAVKRGRGRPKKADSEKTSAKLPQFAKGAKTPAAKKGTHTWGVKGGEKFAKTVRESKKKIDEISAGATQRYFDKASDDWYGKVAAAAQSPEDSVSRQEHMNAANKRLDGIDRAHRRLNKDMAVSEEMPKGRPAPAPASQRPDARTKAARKFRQAARTTAAPERSQEFSRYVKESLDALASLKSQPVYKNSYSGWKQTCRKIAESFKAQALFKGTAELAEARIAGKTVGVWDGVAGVVRLDEKAVSKAQRAAAGIAYAAKKGDIPKSELKGASKEMADMPAGELKKFAKTKEKGLPKKVNESFDHPLKDQNRKEQRKSLASDHKTLDRLEKKAVDNAKHYSKVKEDDSEGEMSHRQFNSIEDAIEELRGLIDAGSDLPEWVQKKITLATDYIDTARDHLDSDSEEKDSSDSEEKGSDSEEKDSDDSAPKSESKDEGSSKGGMYGKGVYESYDDLLAQQLDETVNISTSQSTEGGDSITVTATDQDAHALAEILKMAGLGAAPAASGHCGQEAMQEDYANQPNEQTGTTDELVNKLSGGLNAQKLQYSRGYAGDNDITALGENLWREYSKK